MDIALSLPSLAIFVVSFGVIALSSQQIGRFLNRYRLPLITGFLLTGVLTGPFLLNLISEDALAHLHFVDDASLAFIAFAAGSELYVKEMRDRVSSITWVTVGLVVVTFSLGSLAVFFLADFIPFMQGMDGAGRLAVAMLAGTILVARSPSSAIAIINEVRARGPFTQTALGVTVVMDVVVIVLFAGAIAVAGGLLTHLSFDLGFVGLLAAELLISLTLGYLVSILLTGVMAQHLESWIKSGLILLLGYGVFVLSRQIRHASHDLIGVELLLEPLLICMVGSFMMINRSEYRTDFRKSLDVLGPAVYLAFFTLTGASLGLDFLMQTWPIALALYFVRIGAIYLGAMGGGIIAKEPMSHNRVRWMAFVTQAGVGLGLAREVAVEFPEWGPAFAAMIISLIVLNETTGPLFFKWVINHVGEAHARGDYQSENGPQRALIFGLEGQGVALGRQLQGHGWDVRIASRKAAGMDFLDSDIPITPVDDFDLATLQALEVGKASAIVVMLSDEDNYRICELAYEHCGTPTIVARLNDQANYERFHELGVLVVDPANAMVHVLEQFVRSPSAAALLMGLEEHQEIVDLEVHNTNLHGMSLHDLRLPLDTLILSVHRDNQMLVSHGYTTLHLGDRVTILGSMDSLTEVGLRFSRQPRDSMDPRRTTKGHEGEGFG